MLSPAAYNRVREMMICCPMTSKIKGYPFEVLISHNPASAVLSDQLKSVDWKARNVSKKCQVRNLYFRKYKRRFARYWQYKAEGFANFYQLEISSLVWVLPGCREED